MKVRGRSQCRWFSAAAQQRQSGSSKDISNIDLIKYYKSDVNLTLLNKILHLNILRSIEFSQDSSHLTSLFIPTFSHRTLLMNIMAQNLIYLLVTSKSHSESSKAEIMSSLIFDLSPWIPSISLSRLKRAKAISP